MRAASLIIFVSTLIVQAISSNYDLTTGVVSVKNPSPLDTFKYKCNGVSQAIIVMISGQMGDLTVTADPQITPIALQTDKRADNHFALVSCAPGTVITATMKSWQKDAGTMYAFATESSGTVSAGNPIPLSKPDSGTGLLFEVDDNQKLTTYSMLFPDTKPADGDVDAWVQLPDQTFNRMTTVNNTVTSCPGGKPQTRYGFGLSLPNTPPFALSIQLDNVLEGTVITDKVTQQLADGKIYAVDPTVTALLAAGVVYGYKDCTAVAKNTPTVYTAQDVWTPSFGISDTLFAVTGTANQHVSAPWYQLPSVTGIQTPTPAADCKGQSIPLPDGNCACPAYYKEDGCSELDSSIVSVVSVEPPKPHVLIVPVAAQPALRRFSLIIVHAETTDGSHQHPLLQITLNNAEEVMFLTAAGKAASANPNPQGYQDYIDVKNSMQFGYCSGNGITTFYIGVFTKVKKGTTINVGVVYHSATAGNVINYSDQTSLGYKLQKSPDYLFVCFDQWGAAGFDPKTVQIAIQNCNITNIDDADDKGTRVALGTRSEYIIDDNGVFIYGSEHSSEFLTYVQNGRLVPITLYGNKGSAVQVDVLTVTKDSWPLTYGLENNVAEGTFVIDSSNDKYVANIANKRSDSPKDLEGHYFLVKSPKWNAKLANSPCFARFISGTTATAIQPGTELSITATDTAETYYVIGYEQVPKLPSQSAAIIANSFTVKKADKKKKDDGHKKAAIIGGAVGGSLLVILIVGGFYYWKKQQQRRSYTNIVN